jgi:HK97 family phage major capsid protein
MTPEEQKKLLADVQEKLTLYGEELDGKVKEHIQNGLGESDKKVEDLKKEIEQVNTTIKSLQQQLAYIGSGVPGLKDALITGETDFSMTKFCRALVRQAFPGEFGNDPWKGSEKEKEIVDAWKKEIKTRTTGQYATDGESGGFTIPDEVLTPVNQIARQSNPLESILPITVLNDVYGQIQIPTIKTGTTSYMVGENEAPNTSKMTFGKIIANPKRAAGLCFLSKTLLFQSQGGIDSMINRDLGESLGAKKHQQLIVGSGVEDQVTGLMNDKWGIATSTIAGDVNSGRFNITDALLVQAELQEANEMNGVPLVNYAFLMRPMVKAGMATERIKQYSDQASKRGQPVIQNLGVLDDSALTSIIGKFALSTYLPATETKGTHTTANLSSVYYGDWSRFWLMNWQGMSIRVSDQATVGGVSAFAQNAVWIIIEQGFNCVVVRPTSFRRITGAQTLPTDWS